MKKDKKITCLLLAMLLILNIVPLNSAMAAQKVRLNKSKINLKVNQTKTIKITGTSQKVKWKNGNKKVIKVLTTNKKSIKIKAIREGKTQIIAQVGKKKYYCKIIVKKTEGAQTDFDIATIVPTTTPKVTMEPKETQTVVPKATVEPTGVFTEMPKVTVRRALLLRIRLFGGVRPGVRPLAAGALPGRSAHVEPRLVRQGGKGVPRQL